MPDLARNLCQVGRYHWSSSDLIGLFIVIGTPMKIMVNDARLVTARGDGIHHALHEKPASFSIDTQDMQGDLKVRIEGKKNFAFRVVVIERMFFRSQFSD